MLCSISYVQQVNLSPSKKYLLLHKCSCYLENDKLPITLQVSLLRSKHFAKMENLKNLNPSKPSIFSLNAQDYLQTEYVAYND